MYPNPVSDKIFIPLRISKPLQVLINLVNLDGKMIETWFNDLVIPGDYTYEFTVTYSKHGIYYIQIVSDSHYFSKPITIIH